MKSSFLKSKRRRLSGTGQHPATTHELDGPFNDSDEELPRKPATPLALASSAPVTQDPTLFHYLDGYYILRHGHTPFNTTGGFCDIFTGNHPIYGMVVMKRPRMTVDGCEESKMKNFRAEADIWTKLRHPNILQFIGMIEASDHLWLISPFARNGALPDFLKAHPDTDRERLVLQLIHAIEYLHRQHVVHSMALRADLATALMSDLE